MTSSTPGNGMHVATRDFKLALPAVELPFGYLSPTCKGRVVACSGRRLGDGVLLYWRLEVETIVAVLEGSEEVVVHLEERGEGGVVS